MKGKKRISVVDFLLRAFNISFTLKALYPLFIGIFKIYEASDSDEKIVVILEHIKSQRVVTINTKDDTVMAVDKENDTVTLEVRD